MNLGSGWFGGRPDLAGAQLRSALTYGFRGVGLLPHDPPLRLDGLLEARQDTHSGFVVGSWDAMHPAEGAGTAQGFASLQAADRTTAWAPWSEIFQSLQALGSNLLCVGSPLLETGQGEGRAEKILTRLEEGQLSAADEAVDEMQSMTPAVASGERQLEHWVRFVYHLRRAAPHVQIAVCPSASPQALLHPAYLELFLGEFANDPQVGWWHCMGALEMRRQLELDQPEDWMAVAPQRALGATLQDVAEGQDRLAPGEGKCDFRLPSECLPKDARKVLSLAPSYPVETFEEALGVLETFGFS